MMSASIVVWVDCIEWLTYMASKCGDPPPKAERFAKVQSSVKLTIRCVIAGCSGGGGG